MNNVACPMALQRKLRQAIDGYTEDLRVNPNSASVYYNRGLAYEEYAYYNVAIKDLEKAVEIEPTNADYRKAFEKAQEAEAKREAERKAGNVFITIGFGGLVVGAIIGGFVGGIIGGIGSAIIGDKVSDKIKTVETGSEGTSESQG